jgi:pimeloyl-ACP methyl ester carboxylesterase
MPATDHLAVSLGRWAAACAAVWINAAFTGCSADRPLNPSFPLIYEAARADVRRMQADKCPFQRPVIVCAGIFDPGAGSKWVADRLRSFTTTPELVIDTGFWSCDDFDACREHALTKFTRHFGSAMPDAKGQLQTVEVDAVGVSMGGIVARYAALRREPADPPGPRLNLRRLFTIGSPHHGAAWWDRAPWDQRGMAMRPGGPLIRRLNLAWKIARESRSPDDYDVFAYVRLGDQIVGESNAAGPDARLWWTGNPALEFAHLQAFDDPRILVDIARRLRGEQPFTTEPCTPLPSS